MKKILILLAFIVGCNLNTFSQEQTADTLPYLKYPVLPTFELLMTDSSTKFSTYNIPEGKPIVFIYFSPDCGHCVDFTKELLLRKDDLKKVRIYMATPMSLPMLQGFSDSLGLSKHKNITLGKDFQFFAISFYGIKTFPFVAVYDYKKKLVEGFPGKLTVDDVMKAIARAEK